MTWEQFRKIVEEKMEEQGVPLDVQIRAIVVSDLHAYEEDCVSVRSGQGGLLISNEDGWEGGAGTMTWQQLGGIVEKRMGEQDIPGGARLWFIDVLSPHADEEERVSVEFDRERGGLWISNI